MTALKPHFEKRNDFDAEIQEYPEDIAYNNFAWTKAKLNMQRMTLSFLIDRKSFIAVCNDKTDEKKYFQNFIEAFAKSVSLPLMAFGGYEVKLDHGVKIVYLLQPEWLDYIDHLRRESLGEVEPLNLDWRSLNHIHRESEEAIAALYALGTNVRDIAAMVGVSDRTVTAWKDAHPMCARKRPCQKNDQKPKLLKAWKKEMAGQQSPSEKRAMKQAAKKKSKCQE